MWSILILLIAIFLIWLILKVYFEKFDCVIAYTGGLGSGKTFKAMQQSIKLLKKNRFLVKFNNLKVKLFNLFRVEKKSIESDIPMLYSSIPIFIKQSSREFKLYNLVKLKYRFWFDWNNSHSVIKLNRYLKREEFEKYLSEGSIKKSSVSKFIESSIELNENYLMLQTHINHKSIVFLDEIGGFVNQYEYSNPNVVGALDEFVRLFRHYTKGGYLICTEQCSDSICKPIRVRLNKVFNLMNFKGYFGLLYRVNVREISLSEDIKTLENNNAEDNMKVSIGLFPIKKRYDTYCYSERYNSVPYLKMCDVFDSLKRYDLLKVSTRRIYKPLTSNSREV